MSTRILRAIVIAAAALSLSVGALAVPADAADHPGSAPTPTPTAIPANCPIKGCPHLWRDRNLSALAGSSLTGWFSEGYVDSYGHSQVAYTADDGLVHEIAQYGSTWRDLPVASATSPGGYWPSGYVRGDGVTAVVYGGSDDHVREMTLSSQGWQGNDLTAASGAKVGMNGLFTSFATLSPQVRSDGISTVTYGASDNHIHQLALTGGTIGGSWRDSDLSAATATAGGRRVQTFTSSAGQSTAVYVGWDGDVHALTFTPAHCRIGIGFCIPVPATWSDQDLTSTAQAPPYAVAAMGYVRSDHVTAVVYSTYQGQIYELDQLNGTWTASNILGNAPPAASAFSQPRGFVRSDGITSVVYAGTDGHVHELDRTPSGWVPSDITIASGLGSGAAFANPYTRADGTSAITYIAGNGQVHELDW